MISKFKTIGNLGIFKNFEWDKTVLEKNSTVREFSDINIIYGRNYSGKTTLSRILRSIELSRLPKNYSKPEFEVEFKGGTIVTQNDIDQRSGTIRVFNEDFVRDNLRFIIDPEAGIEPFAILGDDNAKIEEEIRNLKKKLGSEKEGNETGFYKELVSAQKKYKSIQSQYSKAEGILSDQLNKKATRAENSIKKNYQKFGEINYDIRDLKEDIKVVLGNNFTPTSNEDKSDLEKLIEEKTLDNPPSIPLLKFKFSEIVDEAKDLIEKPVSDTGKIEELVKDAILNKWAQEGRKLHKNKRNRCGFCGNKIKEERWRSLENHFDEESEKLETTISNLIKSIESEVQKVEKAFEPDINLFYSRFHTELNELKSSYTKWSTIYIDALEEIKTQLQKRKKDLIHSFSFQSPTYKTDELISIWEDYQKIRDKAINLTEKLSEKQSRAREKLRLREVQDFLDTIKYKQQLNDLEDLADELDKAKENKETVTSQVELLESEILEKKNQLNDEANGAKKVEEYIHEYAEHSSLSLEPIEVEDEKGKQVRFQVVRDGNKAFNLSEGECSLLAFCYYLAKLEDTETKNSKPIIWIDDPISSLDGNHVFFVYSLIKSEIIMERKFQQIFISTHNLDFLKYLRRLNHKGSGLNNAYFLVDRIDLNSNVLPMPKYLKEFATEFNYLFDQIYQCSKIEKIDDKNYTNFYSFGNNARKFLEILLFYKYPDESDEMNKLEKFFGDNPLPAILTDRINNEYSHLRATFERGSLPVEVPEMKKAANLIIDRLKKDPDQYESLLKSIGAETD